MVNAANYRLGLPAWAFPGWKDVYWTAEPTPLASYSEYFTAVEGNTTFYGIPDTRTVAAWRRTVEGKDFRFCFKLPRTVTHEQPSSESDLGDFLTAVEPLGEYLGPLLVQFPSAVGPRDIRHIEAVLGRIPQTLRYVVEVRHPAFFANPVIIDEVLAERGAGRVMLDSRPIHRGDRDHPEVAGALHQKPDLPVLDTIVSGLAFVRLVLHPDPRFNAAYIEQWADRVAGYLTAPYDVYMMIHCPNNLHGPRFARDFHERLRRRSGMHDLAALPPWEMPEQRRLL